MTHRRAEIIARLAVFIIAVQEFFDAWKYADQDLSLLQAAKQEFDKLPN